MATRQAKPDGQFIVMEDGVSQFILDQSVRDLPGTVCTCLHLYAVLRPIYLCQLMNHVIFATICCADLSGGFPLLSIAGCAKSQADILAGFNYFCCIV